jgi:hypothetical protein
MCPLQKSPSDDFMRRNFMSTQNQGQSITLEKLRDAMIPGFVPEFDPDEAEEAGAFEEDAITLADALDNIADQVQDETTLRLVSDRS